MRQVLVDWIIEGQCCMPRVALRVSHAHSTLQVQAQVPDTVHNHLVDFALSLKGERIDNSSSYSAPAVKLSHPSQVNTPRKNLQTLGVAALYVSAKFEERFPPPLRDLEYITGYRCIAVIWHD